MPLVCIQWPRLGPPHFARLHAAHEVFSEQGVGLVALETASESDTYRWRVDDRPLPFRRETVFPGQSYHRLPSARIHAAVYAALERIQPDALLIHSYSTPDAQATLRWAREHRRVAVCMAESRAEDTPRSPYREAIKRALVAQFDAALASGSASTRYIVSLGMPPGCVTRGYSIVDNDYFAQGAEAVRQARVRPAHLPGLADPAPFFFASARFMTRKNLPVLLRAFGAYRRRAEAAGHSPWRLVLLGDGELRPALEALAEAEAPGAVTLPGWLELDALPAYYGLAGAFVHTAHVDQWGLVVNEAMAAGLPVIVSTGTGAAEDLVQDGRNGYTFAPEDEPRLADLLLRVAHQDDRDAMGRASREIIGEWPASLFATGLLEAIRRGTPRAARGLSPEAALVLGALRVAARSPNDFHAVEF
ncbi:MAG: glycosyltransferase [Rubricoccaceae bacterium]